MICYRLDLQLANLAKKNNCIYTRYADDITFSRRKGAMPADLASEGANGTVVVGDALREIIKKNGFQIHPDKVHLYRNTTCQAVTGLTVNAKVNVPREFVRSIRAMIADWRNRGLEAAEKRHHEKFYRHPDRHRPNALSTLPHRFASRASQHRVSYCERSRLLRHPKSVSHWRVAYDSTYD